MVEVAWAALIVLLVCMAVAVHFDDEDDADGF